MSNIKEALTTLIQVVITSSAESEKLIKLLDNIPTVDGGQLIKATAVSQTTDFGVLKDGDVVIHYVTVGTLVEVVEISTDGDLGEAAVVDDYYQVIGQL